jgi:hypothetical protein
MRLPTRVLTDPSGRFETVVVETVVDSIDDHYRRLQAMFADPAMRQAPHIATLAQSGHREFYISRPSAEADPGGNGQDEGAGHTARPGQM